MLKTFTTQHLISTTEESLDDTFKVTLHTTVLKNSMEPPEDQKTCTH